MKIGEDKIDETVFALLQLTLHGECRAWKGMDFEVMNRLHQKRYIHDPVNKAKSVILTEKGLAKSEQLFKEKFAIMKVQAHNQFSHSDALRVASCARC